MELSWERYRFLLERSDWAERVARERSRGRDPWEHEERCAWAERVFLSDRMAKRVLVHISNKANVEGVCGCVVFFHPAKVSRALGLTSKRLRRCIRHLAECGAGEFTPQPDGEVAAVFDRDFSPPDPWFETRAGLATRAVRAFNATCAHCKKRGSERSGPDGGFWTLDRIVPGAAGGRYTAENVALSCWNCNSARGDKHPGKRLPSVLEMERRR